MFLRYYDQDTKELIEEREYYTVKRKPGVVDLARIYASGMRTSVVSVDTNFQADCHDVYLEVPLPFRRTHTPLPGDLVEFPCEGETCVGTYHFRRCDAYVVRDPQGKYWEVDSRYQMKRVRDTSGLT
jgi:hypothetical protein